MRKATTREEMPGEERSNRTAICKQLHESRRNVRTRVKGVAELEHERHLRLEAERIARMKDEFLANISHELRTPLNAILGWSQLLKQGKTNDSEMAEGLEIIRQNALAQGHLINDLLDISRIITGKLRLDVQLVEMQRVIAVAVESVQLAAKARGVRLESVVKPIAGPIAGDPHRLQQVAWNLLTNAIKFTPRGGTVRIVLEQTNSQVQLSVSDTGKGITAQLLPHVFERFTQGDSCPSPEHSGLGLGLSIVKELVELHGGSVTANSAGEGKGATFIVLVPICDRMVQQEQTATPKDPE